MTIDPKWDAWAHIYTRLQTLDENNLRVILRSCSLLYLLALQCGAFARALKDRDYYISECALSPGVATVWASPLLNIWCIPGKPHYVKNVFELFYDRDCVVTYSFLYTLPKPLISLEAAWHIALSEYRKEYRLQMGV